MPTFDELWKVAEDSLRSVLQLKNAKVWRRAWEGGLARSYLDGMAEEAVGPVISASELAQSYFEKQGLRFAKELTETDLRFIRQTLIDNWDDKSGFLDAIRETYICSEARGERIWDNETHIAYRSGNQDYARSDGKTTKTWVTTGSDAMCEECEAMDGETVPIDEPYSNGMMTAHAHNGCQCDEEFS